MHISRISRENEKWFCETFLARNAAARNCGKNRPFLANFEPKLTKIWDFSREVTSLWIEIAVPDDFAWFLWSCIKIYSLLWFDKKIIGENRPNLTFLHFFYRISRIFSREMGQSFSHLARNWKREKCACLAITQILREIKFEDSRSAKSAI